MGKIYFYNTLTRKKEAFNPLKKGKAGIYTCGPTVYWYPHIGNMRSYIFSDLLKRALLYNGYNVKHVINVTDVGHLTSDSEEGEDKMEVAAKKEKKSARQIADHYFGVFLRDFKKLGLLEPGVWPRASDHINEQIELIKKLEKKGYTYTTSDGIYFDSSKFKKYGKLAKLNIKGLKAGKRVGLGEKKHPTDFALWKFSSEKEKRQQEWDSPFGKGFPGWHIECSAMAMKYLGESFDIHTGGEDHIPVHHTNEIAQSECATGKKFANYWLHGAFLTFRKEKVSKSTGGLFTLSELEEKGYNSLVYRYLCLQAHYRKPLEFSLESMDAAKNAYEKLKRKVVELRKEERKGNDLSEEYGAEFLKAVNDDLNMPKALGVFWKALDDFDFAPKAKLKLLESFDSVLGLCVKDMKEEKVEVPADVMKMVEAREEARRKKMWAEADIIRERIRERGFLVEDKPEGPKVNKIN
jgi:cysteinyl-tRNA synthetase